MVEILMLSAKLSNIKKPLCNLKCSILGESKAIIEENCRNYNIKLPRMFILLLLIVSPLHKDLQTI